MTVFTHFENVWQEGAPLVQSAMAQSFMHGSTVFDGARAFNGCVPDLDRHFSRLIHSAQIMGLKSPLGVQEITDLAIEGVKKFPANAELYIRPSLFAEGGFLVPDADDVRFVMTVFDVPMPEPSGFGACLTDFRRPNPNMAPTEAKAACLYPNSSLAIKEANRRGFDNAVMRDGADTRPSCFRSPYIICLCHGLSYHVTSYFEYRYLVYVVTTNLGFVFALC